METFGDKKAEKLTPKKLVCEKCNYFTSKMSSFKDHLKSKKHSIAVEGDANSAAAASSASIKNQSLIKKYKCKNCEKIYLSRNGLWKHKKNCYSEDTDFLMSDKDLVMMLIKQNKDLLDIVKNGSCNTTNSNNYSNNKTFNMQFFLNETCKDAININDFVKNIKLQISDLEETGRVGYVQGISNIIKKNLNNIEYHNRPIHCSDIKREILYIKDENEWIKETDNKPILIKAIKKIANENIKQIIEFRKLYPDCNNSESIKNNLYLNIISNSISGSTKEETDKNINKIIKNLLKEVIIDK